MSRGFPHAHDVVDLYPLGIVDGKTIREPGKRLRLHLFRVANHMIDLGKVGKPFRLDLCRAPRHNYARSRTLAPQSPDRLRRLPHCLGCHRARVDNHGIIKPGGDGMRLHHLGLVSIQPAPERDDRRLWRSRI